MLASIPTSSAETFDKTLHNMFYHSPIQPIYHHTSHLLHVITCKRKNIKHKRFCNQNIIIMAGYLKTITKSPHRDQQEFQH
jgi:hypothetical protein